MRQDARTSRHTCKARRHGHHQLGDRSQKPGEPPLCPAELQPEIRVPLALSVAPETAQSLPPELMAVMQAAH